MLCRVSVAFNASRFPCVNARVSAYNFSTQKASWSNARHSSLFLGAESSLFLGAEACEARSHHSLASSARNAVATVFRTAPTRAKTSGFTSGSVRPRTDETDVVAATRLAGGAAAGIRTGGIAGAPRG